MKDVFVGKTIEEAKANAASAFGADISEIKFTVIEEPKKGLSGGAIAGIVVGSTVVVGTGGFAVWWFAIQKHTFAELGTACKSIAGKVGGFFNGIFEKIKKLFSKK